MAITLTAAEFILSACRDGLKMGKTLTIGRQGAGFSPGQARQLLERYGRWSDKLDTPAFYDALSAFPAYTEGFLKACGAESVDAMDFSDYEGANILHDLNQPLPADLKERYDFVLDCGTLEHVFNFPTAITNYMDLVKPGGSLIIIVPANNAFGHGFFQFSPELFFRVFTPENGFEPRRVAIAEDDVLVQQLLGFKLAVILRGKRRDVVDPDQVRRRVELVSSRPAILLVHAKKIASVRPFRKAPYQSDYSVAWEAAKAERPAGALTGLRGFLRRRLSQRRLSEIYFRVLPVLFRPLYAVIPHGWFGGRNLGNRLFYK